MLNPKKKLAKKEIKQDTLLASYAQATSFYYENKKYVNYALTALVVVIIAIVVFVNNRRANNEKATSEMARVMSIYDAGASDPKQYQIAITGQPEKGILGLKRIVDEYGNSEAGEVARLYLANAYYLTSQYELALSQYEAFSGNSGMLKASASAGIGSCYEVKHEYAKAASAYERAAGISGVAASAPEYLNLAARCFGLSGEKEKAISLLKRIKKEFPASAAARDADRYIGQFSI